MQPSSSPLSLRIRTKLLGPGVIEPISSVLQVFFAPPVLIPVLIAIVVQALFLVIQLVGLSFILYNVARVPVTLTRDAVRTRRWRLAGTTLGATAAVLLAVALVWTTQLSASGSVPSVGTEHFPVSEWTHADEPILVDQSPPEAAN